VLLAAAGTAAAQEPTSTAVGVFRRFAPAVVTIQTSEIGSGAKESLGTGFYVSGSGDLITNFHVIAERVHHPQRYKVELLTKGGARSPVELVAIDVVHDLALLRTDHTPALWLPLQGPPLEQGARLYSLGNPFELGLSIVEGTYNGLLEHSLYQKIHFTGALNPGMSGGPTITESGAVVGINVSTAGNEVSFLVPAARAAELLARGTTADYQTPGDFLDVVSSQLLANQEAYLAPLFGDSVPTTRLGDFLLPTTPAPFFNCWGDADRSPSRTYETVDHYCSTDDYLFISGSQSSGIVEFEHRLLTSDELSRFRFYNLYSDHFHHQGGSLDAGDDELTDYSCRSRNIRHDELTLRAVVCVRGYRRMPGLYDAVITAASLGEPHSGLVSTLTLSGVSFENVRRLAERYLRSIRVSHS